jgi:ATP-dependent Lhr-like helicase
VASRYGSFPVVLETMRECLQDVFDVPALVELMRDVAARRIRFVEVETAAPSPFARSLLFGYVASFLYEGDAPLAERRAQALAIDSTLLAELLGRAELRELLDVDVLDRLERELQRLTDDRRARDVEDAADLLRRLGPLSAGESAARGVTFDHLHELESARRAVRVRIAGEERWAAIEDAGRLRDALGVPLPVGVPEAFLESVRDPLGDLVSRFARTHGPFPATVVADRFGLGVAVVGEALTRLAAAGRVVAGEFRPGGSGIEWCDAEVLRILRRRSLAALRSEVEPVPPAALARFLPAWQHAGPDASAPLRRVDGLLRAVEQLQGAAVPASALESLVLPARVVDYSPPMLDELTAGGEVVWAGSGALPGDGWVSLYLAETAALLLPPVDEEAAAGDTTPLHAAVRDALSGDAALFFRALADRVGALDDAAVSAAVWDLVWAGLVTNDTLAPLRVLLSGGRPAHRARRPTPVRRPGTGRALRGLGRPAMPSRSGPATMAGRWSLLPERTTDPTLRASAVAETLLDRHGVLTRGAVLAERSPGGFAAAYRVLSAYEEAGRCRRGYFVEGLGAAQFALPGAVERIRTLAPALDAAGDGEPREPAPPPPGWLVPTPAGWSAGRPRRDREDRHRALVLAAADPAQPYGAALPWRERPGEVAGGHRPGRKAGALVVLVDGLPVLYVERGGRSLLTWTDDGARLQPAVDALALAIRDGALGRLTVERADGQSVHASALGVALEAAGFTATPRGLRLRG